MSNDNQWISSNKHNFVIIDTIKLKRDKRIFILIFNFIFIILLYLIAIRLKHCDIYLEKYVIQLIKMYKKKYKMSFWKINLCFCYFCITLKTNKYNMRKF